MVAGEAGLGRAAYSFFLKAVILEDALDAAVTDGHPGLSDFLGDDLGGGVGIEETMADDLSIDFVGSAVVGFGSPFPVPETLGATLAKTSQDLEVMLPGVVVFSSGPRRPEAFTLTFEKHGQFQGDFIVAIDRQRAGLSFENEIVEM
jgi:hypothetical protein